MSVSDLPALNASLNALATILLTAGFVFIKQRQVSSHRLCMVSAFVVSCVFLVTYVLHKILMRGVHTPFGGEGAIRTIYYTMLISHIILAMVIVPLVLATLRYAVVGRIDVHRKWARWTFPSGTMFLLQGSSSISSSINGSLTNEWFGTPRCSRCTDARHSRR